MIILRPERFGGIIFNTVNAHEVWADKKTFEKIKNNKTDVSVLNKDENMAGILKELDIKAFKHIKLLPCLQDITHSHPFPILNSPLLADINITNKCNLHCPHCYVNSTNNGEEMTSDNFEILLRQCVENNILQVAIGGGEPTTHPYFSDFLKKFRQHGIVPNITTNGKELKWKAVYNMAKYCGAVALSIEEWGDEFERRRNFPFSDFLKSIKKIRSAGINLVFQVVISKNNLNTLLDTTQRLLQFKPYGIIFLAYKPQGRGRKYDAPLSEDDPYKTFRVLDEIFHLSSFKKTKIGFDCCLAPSLLSVKENPSLAGCSAARTSLAVMPDLRVLPCSFMKENKNSEFDNLISSSLFDIWRKDNFYDFRKKIESKMKTDLCSECSVVNTCLGGCPEFSLVQCNKV